MGRPAVLKVDIIADAKGVSRGVSEAEGKFGKLGGTMAKVGKYAAAGLAAAGAAAGAFAYKSIGAASDVEQSFGALETIYGKNADQVKRWAAQAADSVGLAKSEYANLSALVGSQLQGMGTSQDASAKKSAELIKLGSDLAATYGGSVANAVGAVSSLLKGEADPIERYGVSIKQSDVNARLAAEGLDGLTGSAAKQADAQARLALLNEQTAKTTGAFARESNTLAGQQERLKAKFENLQATLGEKLLPVATRVVTWVSEKMLPGAQRLGATLQARLGPAFAAVAGFIQTRVIPAARSFVSWFLEKIVPGIQRYLIPIIAGARAAFARVSAAVDDNSGSLSKLGGWIKKIAEFAAKYILPVIGDTVGAAFRTMGKAIEAVITVISQLVDWIDTAIGKVQDLIGWVKNIDIPDIKLPGFLGGAAAGYATASTPAGGFATGSASPSSWSTLLATPARTATPVVVDNRVDVRIDATGGLVDEAALARKLEGVLERHAQRLGRPTAGYGLVPA